VLTVAPVLELDPPPAGGGWPQADEDRLVEALRRGDGDAYREAVGRYHPAMVRLARSYVRDGATAEEVAQDAWLGVLRGIERFEGRSSLKTWLLRIVAKRARSRWQREARSVPLSLLSAAHPAGEDTPLGMDELFRPGEARVASWAACTRAWAAPPDERMLAGEAAERIRAVIATLPPGQRRVITLRDVEGRPGAEVCRALGISEGNQRVLLHRARTKVRATLADEIAA
jgi:RNA polymerase sigma-70 factor, ECF subfamily